ncbi:MAG: ATP-binding cassette domain-containing protein [Chloroflexi bacterium]|nr:ATP-binding cassette domain-containing protein [Chloroflexota bacterium]
MTTEPIIETFSLCRKFGELKAVDNLTISVAPGEVFGMLGPNGAGKTTAIKMLITLLPPTSGDARVAGFSIRHQASRVRRKIGYVPQMISADATLTGYENLLVFARIFDVPRSERKDKVHDALNFMGLADSANKLVRTYSGGMIRRLEIAQSILHQPEVLYLDEPTIGLDPLARKAVWEHIIELKQRYNTTIFMTTHLMEEADSLCNRVSIMHHGKVVALGMPSVLKANIGNNNATLEDVFIHFTGDRLAEDVSRYKDTEKTRNTARRLG